MVELAGELPRKQKVAYCSLSLRFPEMSCDLSLVGLDRITSSPGSFSVEKSYEVFPHVPPGSLDKPSGEVQLLIASDNIRLMPGGGLGPDQVDNLRVFDLPVAPYKVLMGSHPEISFTNPALTPLVQNYRAAQFTSLPPTPGLLCSNYVGLDFLEAEALAVHLPAKCKKCLACENCSIQEKGMTMKEWNELQMLKDSVRIDPVTQKAHVSYPIVGDIGEFKDNRGQACMRVESLQRGLVKKGMMEYNACVQDFIDRGVWKEVSALLLLHYFAIRGQATFIYSDQGSQLSNHEDTDRPKLDVWPSLVPYRKWKWKLCKALN